MPAAPRVARNCLSSGLDPASFGFPRELRLLEPAEFRFVFERPERSQDAYLTVLARVNAKGYARLGLAISKKSVRKAAHRNLLKRLARESFRLRRRDLGKLDFVVMARPAARNADRSIISKSLERHWKILVQRCDSHWCNSSSSTD